MQIKKHSLKKRWMKSSIENGIKTSGKILFKNGYFKIMEETVKIIRKKTVKIIRKKTILKRKKTLKMIRMIKIMVFLTQRSMISRMTLILKKN